MKVIIDRFEGDCAVCEREDRTMIQIEKSLLPQSASEGDSLIIEHGVITIDPAETERRRKRIEKMMEDLWNE